ncbi:amidase [Pseudodonghicola flavimaris]|uniref:Amidase n=1 Tax=Pseudodonghicola flavimaris TaxID=3050036 RepID=A0ABT7F512_9RHOB|nr:amidase [Pseudodonghicola flavimaris]MDK3019705.1 amidase [Pseudodonghicola flavimaris]
MTQDLTELSATEAVDLLTRKEITPLELIDAAAARTEAVDGEINALPIRFFEAAREKAERLQQPEDGRVWLAGLPIAVKDLSDVAGQRTTKGGSALFRENVAETSSYEVAMLERNGALPVAKATSPEFGFNATTYSELFGYTRNPWNTSRSTAGSSGGSAAAVAAGAIWLATGSDLGASIRAPAGFCGVVGLRPSPGLVAKGPSNNPFSTLPVAGPIARTVADAALMLDAMVGLVPADPLSFPPTVPSYRAGLERELAPTRAAVSVDLGITYCHSEIAAAVRKAGRVFETMGAEVEETCPDFSGIVDAFYDVRGFGHIVGMGPLVDRARDRLTPEITWSVDTARALEPEVIARGERTRAAVYARVAAFFDSHDLLLIPTAVVPPFPVEWTTVERCEDHRFDRYIDWIAITFAISMMGLPAISVPCGFTSDGMPIGLQIVGRPRGEAEVLQAAAAFERAAGLGRLTPILPRAGESRAP